MKVIPPVVVMIASLFSTTLDGQAMRIARSGSTPAQPGPSATFSGSVSITPVIDSTANFHPAVHSVTFTPGARSAWHTHPKGQLLVVTAGTGRIQQTGGPIQEIRAGDTIWTPPGRKHWHGASPDAAMTHLSLVESLNGKAVDWLEKVTDVEYNAEAAAANARSAEPSAARKAFGDIAPALATYTDEVLFGDVWKRPGLSPRDRSLVTVSALVAGYRSNELPFHLKRALDHGVSQDELIELITHLAFYSGWPTANTALPIARTVFEEANKGQK